MVSTRSPTPQCVFPGSRYPGASASPSVAMGAAWRGWGCYSAYGIKLRGGSTTGSQLLPRLQATASSAAWAGAVRLVIRRGRACAASQAQDRTSLVPRHSLCDPRHDTRLHGTQQGCLLLATAGSLETRALALCGVSSQGALGGKTHPPTSASLCLQNQLASRKARC